MSHYNAWKRVVDNDIDYAMIIEDDVDLTSIDYFYRHCNFDISLYDYIQLSARIHIDDDDRYIFDGGESYIINKKMAQTLIDVTHYPNALRDINPSEYPSIQKFFHKNTDLTNYNKWNNNSVCAAVDKFMGYCCESQFLDIKSHIYPIVKLDKAASLISSIETQGSEIFDTLHETTIHYYHQQMLNSYNP